MAKSATSKKLVSIRAFAKQINVSEGAVRRAIREGKFKAGYNVQTKKIDPHAAQKNAWVKEQNIVKPKAGVSLNKAIEKLDNGKEVKRKKDVDGEDDLFAEDMSVEDLLRTVKVSSKMSTDTAFKNQAIINLAQSRQKLMQDAGLLIDKGKVEAALFKIGNEMKKELMNIPKRIASDVRAAPDEVTAMNIMNDEFTRVLSYYGNLKLNIT